MRTREDRQRATAAMTRCRSCGQIARRGSDLCGSCDAQESAAEALREGLWACESLHDLQNWIEENVLPKIS